MNSTHQEGSPLLGSPDVDNIISGLPYIQNLCARYRPELEMLWVLLTYAPFLTSTFRYTSPKFARHRNYPPFTTTIHIFSAFLLVLRYHARYAATRTWPCPELPDLLLFAVFNISSFFLEAHRASVPQSIPVVRAGFQVSVLMHAAVFGASWVQRCSGGGGGQVFFRASVKFMNWFASFRAIKELLGLVDPRLAQPKNTVASFEVTMVLSLPLGLWEAGVPAGVPASLVLLAGFLIMERAVAEAVFGMSDSNPCKRLILASGYVDFNLLREKKQRYDEARVVEGDGLQVEI
ncbi:hypothetical protein M406DRAFT_68540 [Cryphonectria parasitica EP155]|uniref:Uncharacterized protein n=1 Tax=Cryphonectria parasitica (strain ATCC 38755 / EP155) TaxID=660469 RepID=A0A9P4Y4U2_CRYP1|nr:uncharacterized protein M406DRAFT_68540 [Cryphonectria parasitica EP155]KAF3766170.1 hypothetical protein M406DRAFT_68540 [Cryphonectria parasitica EP155]